MMATFFFALLIGHAIVELWLLKKIEGLTERLKEVEDANHRRESNDN
jgi:hypothetical protein